MYAGSGEDLNIFSFDVVSMSERKGDDFTSYSFASAKKALFDEYSHGLDDDNMKQQPAAATTERKKILALILIRPSR